MRFKLTQPKVGQPTELFPCRTWIRPCWIIALGLVLALINFCILSRPVYLRHQESLALRRATNFLAKGQLRSASLSARQVLTRNPTNVEACRVMAEVSELSGSTEVLEWRRRLAGLSSSVESKLQLAASALEIQPPPYALASEVLGALVGVASNDIGYCNLSAQLALKTGRRSEAEKWFAHATQLQPSNHLHLFNLAILGLSSINTVTARQARATLIDISIEPALALPALRSLTADSLVRRDLTGALAFSARLQAQPRLPFSDRLNHLEILSRLDSSEFEPFLDNIQSQSHTNATLAADLITTLIRCGLAKRARSWLDHCPPEVRTTTQLQLANAECAVALKDWAGLEEALRPAHWGDFEPMRLALLAHAAFETGHKQGAQLRWELALKQARGKLGSLLWLLARTEIWGRRPLRLDVLWQLSREFPSEQWALAELATDYRSTGETCRLHDVYAQRLRVAPADCQAGNNFAATGLLLRTNLASAHALARRLHAEYPRDPVIASTFAYSLHLEGRTREALSLFEQLPLEFRYRPDISLYHGILLRADGQTTKASEAFQRAQGAELLPEERNLLSPLLNSEAEP